MASAVEASERFVAVPGGEVYVRTWTPAAGISKIPVVLLHDSLGCVAMWRQFPALLAGKLGRPVIAYDRLGFGRSSARTELPSLRFIAEETETFLPVITSALGIARLIPFGHSVGGCMAIVWAGLLGETCPAVVSESAQAFVEGRTREGVLRAKEEFSQPAMMSRLEVYHGTKASWVVRAWTQLWLSPQYASWSLAKDLPKVRCPLLAIHGEQDEYGSVRFPEMICELAGGAAEKLIIPGCGHVPHREKPDVVLDAVDRFLADA
jgi:pimeloyl-ACP methyl ester carboxylesterase